MKIDEVVSQHPAVAKQTEYNRLLKAGEDDVDDIIEFIMDDRNAEARRIEMLRHLDELIGDVEDEYTVDTLNNFMYNVEFDSDISPEEYENFKKDMRLPPYHLQVVEGDDDETENTGEYELCQTCGGEGEVHWDHADEWTGDHIPAGAPCPDCEGGLKDITGQHRIPDFTNF